MSNTLAYLLDGKIYINLTNKCTNNCVFCLRNDKDDVCGKNMWLLSENYSAVDVIEQIVSLPMSEEITFCGYGEPTLKLNVLIEVAKYLKEKYPNVKLRLNTNGHANFICKRNVIEDLKDYIDVISVSLNATTDEEYIQLSQPCFENAYEEVKKFVKASVDAGIKTFVTVVDNYKGKKMDLELCNKVAKDLGATLRVREWIQNGY